MASSSSWVKHSRRDRDIYHAQVRKTGPSPERGLWVATNIYIYKYKQIDLRLRALKLR